MFPNLAIGQSPDQYGLLLKENITPYESKHFLLRVTSLMAEHYFIGTYYMTSRLGVI